MKKKLAWLMIVLLLLAHPPLFAGTAAPDFSGKGVDGKNYALSDYQGKNLVLYFWATWCPACVRDAKNFAKVYEAHHGKEAEFVAVSLDKDFDKLKSFIKERKVQYPVLFAGQSWDNPIAQAYEVDSTPTYVLISSKGEILKKGSYSKTLEEDLVNLGQHGTQHFTRAPDFSGTDIDGIHHSLSDYQGKQLVLYFWATWCPACRKDTKNIQNLFPKLQGKGIEFVSVSLDKNLETLQDYVQKNALTFPILFDGKGWDNEISDLYGIQSTPTYILISPEGDIAGTGNWSQQLEKLLS